jgi:hypothetical protein
MLNASAAIFVLPSWSCSRHPREIRLSTDLQGPPSSTPRDPRAAHILGGSDDLLGGLQHLGLEPSIERLLDLLLRRAGHQKQGHEEPGLASVERAGVDEATLE